MTASWLRADLLDRLSSSSLIALALACALGLLLLAGVVGGVLPTRAAPVSGPTDIGLYQHATEAARHPASYYAEVVAEQRREGYPLRPFLTVRPPTLAFLLAPLPGESARRLLLGALGLVVLGAWAVRLRAEGLAPVPLTLGLIALSTGLLSGAAAQAYAMHEQWAGLLIALSLALWRPDRWGWSLAFGLAAALIRELAAPYLVVMAAMAFVERKPREGAAWLASLALFAAALAAHAYAVSLYVLPTDIHSAGWLSLGGWPFLLHALQWNAVLAAGPAWLAVVLAPLALLGAASWRGPLGVRLGLIVLGYVSGLLVFGRPENAYWGLMIVPLLSLALVKAPEALLRIAHPPTAGPPGWPGEPAPAQSASPVRRSPTPARVRRGWRRAVHASGPRQTAAWR